MLSYDPDKSPSVDFETFKEAHAMGLHPVYVNCDEPGSRPGDVGGVSFVTFLAFIPRAGDRIRLQDRTLCEVRRVYYQVGRLSNTQIWP